MNSYQKAVTYLQSFTDYERLTDYSYEAEFNLRRIKAFLKSINNPQENLKVIHVAGSKGKGSVCAFIAYILKEAGFKVGLYTSPHLNDIRERFRVLDTKYGIRNTEYDFEGMISQRELSDLVSGLKPAIDKFNKNSKYGVLTFFEVLTALVFQYFSEKQVDFAVLEVGLGGRLDATNVCSSLISVVTPISYEHTVRLGKTLQKIAYEKASIIKKENKKGKTGKIIALTSKQPQQALKVIRKIAKKNNAFLLKAKGDFKINLLGQHQKENAALAVAAVNALRYHNIKVSKRVIQQGLKKCRWPARFEIISQKPLIVLDGAQNAASVKALNRSIKQIFPNRKAWIIFGLLKDKELKGTCREIEKISNRIILTKVNNPRASEPKDLLKYFSRNSLLLTDSSKDALNLAKEKANKKDLILATGSLYLCGEVRKSYVK